MLIWLPVILLIVFACYVAFSKNPRNYDLIDIYVFGYALYFAVYTAMKFLVVGVGQYNQVIGFLTGLFILTGCIGVWMIARVVFSYTIMNAFSDRLKLVYLIEQAGRVHPSAILFVLTLACIFQTYSLLHYGIVYDYVSIDGVNISLPYWFTSVHSIYKFLVFILVATVFCRFIVAKSRRTKLQWLLAMLICFLLMATLGRRAMFFTLFVCILIYFATLDLKLISARSLISLAIVSIFFIGYSNFYDGNRGVIEFGYLKKMHIADARADLKISLTKTANTRKTYDSIAARPYGWHLIYKLMSDRASFRYSTVPHRNIFLFSLQRVIPRVIYPNKPLGEGLDELLEKNYGLASVDLPDTLLSFLVGDFGFYSIFIYIILMSLLLVYVSLLLKLVESISLAFPFIFNWAVYYLLSVESNPVDYFLFLRNTALLAVLFFLFSIPWLLKKWNRVSIS